MSDKQIFPDLKWAQRKERVYATIDLQDVENHKIDLTPEGHLKFEGESHGNKYIVDFDLFAEVDVEESKWNVKGRNIMLNIVKKDQEAEYWPRITKEKVKNPHIHIDWTRWVDEDDEGEESNPG